MLELRYCEGITDAILQLLAISNLRALQIVGCGVTGVRTVGASPTIFSFMSSNCPNLTDAAFGALTRTITVLDLSSCKNLTDVGVGEIVKLPLSELYLRFNKITDAGAIHIATCGSLRELSLMECPFISDVGIIRGCPLLRVFDVSYCVLLTDAAFGDIASCTKLESLDISNCTVTQTTIDNVAGCLWLREITLYGVFVNPYTLLKSCSNLHTDNIIQYTTPRDCD